MTHSIVGATSLEQLASNLAFAGVELSQEAAVLGAIDEIHLHCRNPSLFD